MIKSGNASAFATFELPQHRVQTRMLLTGAADDKADLHTWAEGIMRSGKGFTEAALGLLGTAFGMLVHQVANHCFERGGLMATLWNMYTALMGSRRGDEV